MTDLLARLRVVARALPTWLALVALAAPVIAEEAAEVLPDGWGQRVTAIALTVAAVAVAALNVIRRLTPVAPEERGLLPDPRPAVPDDAGAVTLTHLLLLAILVVLLIALF